MSAAFLLYYLKMVLPASYQSVLLHLAQFI